MKRVHVIGETLEIQWCRACGTVGYLTCAGKPSEKRLFQRPVIAQALRIDEDWENKGDKT